MCVSNGGRVAEEFFVDCRLPRNGWQVFFSSLFGRACRIRNENANRVKWILPTELFVERGGGEWAKKNSHGFV